MFPKYSEVAVTNPEYQACKQLAKGLVYADEAEKLSKLGMIVDNDKICNFKYSLFMFILELLTRGHNNGGLIQWLNVSIPVKRYPRE